MTINEYQDAALRTAQTEELTHIELVINAAEGKENDYGT